MFKMQTWQLVIVVAVAVACVGYMAVTIARMFSRPAVGTATVRSSTPVETGLIGAEVPDGARVFDGWSYRTPARYAGRVRVVATDEAVTIAGPRAPVALYATWIWLQGITLALVPAALVLAAVKLDWRALLLALGVFIVSAIVMAIGAGVWPGLGETALVADGSFEATEIPLDAVHDVTIGEGWARDGLRLVIAPYAAGIDPLAAGRAVCFNAPDGFGHDRSWAIHMLSEDDARELSDLLTGGDGQ
ncbi:MAG: hypothetical protein JW733_04805 [Coriobacteriia bacterium]|nr:hypothetical protein [Coriobacteriia bacterium]MBN2847415.1 hypothetical protein [Coriobacteriia bacterium]